MIAVIMINTPLKAQNKRINNSSTSVTRGMVKLDEVDASSKSIKKLSKSC